MSLRRKILLGLLVLVVLMPSIGVYWVATTESGLNFLMNRLDKVGPVALTATGLTGTLTRGVRVESLRIQHRLSDITVEDAEGRVKLLPLLFRRQVDVVTFRARHLAIRLIDDPVERPKRTPRFLPGMLRIDAREGHVDQLDLTLESGRLFTFRNLSGIGTVLTDQIRIQSGSMEWEDWHVDATGRVLAARPYGLEGSMNALWTPRNQPQWRIAGTFDGDLDALPLTLEISEPFHSSVKGSAVLRSGWSVDGDAHVVDFDLVPFGGGDVLGLINGDVKVHVDADGITARGQLTPPGLQAGAFDVDFNGQYADRHVDIRETVIVHPESGSRATVRGTVDVDNGLRIALHGDWRDFRWPLVGKETAFVSPQGRYTLAGSNPWQVTAEGDVIAADLPRFPARARGVLDPQSFLIEEGSAQLLGGNATFTGNARWNPAESWQLAGRMVDMDPAQLRSDLPGKLSFDFNANGAPFGNEGNIAFSMANLTGTVRDQRATGKGTFLLAAGSEDWSFREVSLALGNTRVQLDGRLGDRPDLTFAVEAEDLGLFDREARGRVKASGHYGGTPDAPVLRLNATGDRFEWGGYKLQRLAADIDVDLSPGVGRAQGNVDITQLELGERTIARATLALAGGGDQQQITLAVDATPLRAVLGADGAIRDGLWQGQLTSLTVQQEDGVSLKSEAPAPLSFNLRQFDLANTCVKGNDERLCASAQRLLDGTYKAAFTADSVPLSTFTAGMSQDFRYEGRIDVRGEVSGAKDMPPVGTLAAQLENAQLHHRLGAAREEAMSLGTGTINAEATAGAFNVQVALDAGSAGNIRGRLDGERIGTEWLDFPIRGSLDAQTNALALLDIYVDEIDKATGRLNTRVSIGGTLGTPTLLGELEVRDASIDIYQINLALRNVSLDARLDSNALDVSGKSSIGAGQASFEGRMTWRDGRPYGNLHVEGDRLLVVDVPEARIQASPKLDFKVADRRIDVTGEVTLPYGRIEPADLTTAVLSSGDEVLVGAPEVDPSQKWTVISNIRLNLGDDVRIETLGLAARLGGGLQLRTDEFQNTRAQGDLTISDGKYAALGRLLDVDRGRLIYDNVPLGDPGIDLRAQKVYPDVTAGVNVRGSLRAPRLTFYSEPQLPQSQIASLILAGGSISSLQDSQAPGAARNDLLAQGGAILAQRVGGSVGLDDVGIESDINNQSALVVGKYLSPRLYISYGISLAEAINTLKLRWTITDRWTIRTEAGQERSADIVFTLKK